MLNVLEDGSASWAEILARLSSGFRRAQSQRFRVLSIIAGGSRQTLNTVEVEIRAKQLIRFMAEEMFTTGIDDVRDGSRCELANNIVAREGGRYVRINSRLGRSECRKGEDVCNQVGDLQLKLDRLRAAAQALAASQTEACQKDGKAALRAVTDPQNRKGQNCYQKLGDISIALDCGTDELLLTTDASFEVMAPALGLRVHRLQHTPAP